MSKKQAQKQALLIKAYNEYAQKLNSWAFYKTSDRSLADDLVQNTFLKTWAYLSKGGEIETMKAFLYNVLNNLIVDEYRRRKTVSLEVLLEKGFEPRAQDSEPSFQILDGEKVLS